MKKATPFITRNNYSSNYRMLDLLANRVNSKSASYRIVSAFLLILFVFINYSQSQINAVAAGNAPGTPPGSYSLSDLEAISLYSGKVNTVVPLVRVGGRGDAGYTISYTIDDSHWSTYADTPPSGVTSLTAEDHPEYVYNPGRSVFPQAYEYGTISVRWTAADLSAFPDPYPDGPPTYFRYAAIFMVFTAADGTEHTLYDEKRGGWNTQMQGTGNTGNFFPDPDRGLIFSSKDGSGMTFISDPLCCGQTEYYVRNDLAFYPASSRNFYEEKVTGYLKYNNGTIVRFEDSRAKWIQDRNGNRTTFVYEMSGQSITRLDKIIDANNRVTDIVYGNGYDQIVYSGTGGQPRTITINRNSLQSRLYPNTESIHQISGLFPAYPNYGSPYSVDNGSVVYNPSVTSQIVIPDGRSYNFYYNAYGELSRIETPDGAGVEYDYGSGSPVTYNTGPGLPTYPSGQVGGVFHYGSYGTGTSVVIYRRILERREYANGGTTPTLKTTYGRFENLNNQYLTGKVREDQIDPVSNVVLTRQDHYFNGSPVAGLLASGGQMGLGDTLEGRETKTETLDAANNTVLAYTETQWSAGCLQPRVECGTYPNVPQAWEPFVISTINGVLRASGGQYKVSKQAFDYDKYNNPIEAYEYDFDNNQAGELKRRTHTDYVTDTNYVLTANANLRNLPSAVKIYGYQNSQEVLVAQSEMRYDETTLTPRSYVTGWSDPQRAQRGNLTTERSWLHYTGQTDAWLETKMEYDVLGNKIKEIDPKNNISTIGYGDSFGAPDGEARTNNTQNLPLNGLSTFAFRTSVTNQLGWKNYAQFDYYTGQPVDAEDINEVVSSTFYEDSLDRATKTITANNVSGLRRQSLTVYTDFNAANSSNPRKITTFSDLNGFDDKLLKSEIIYDGLGRALESRKYESNGGYIATKSVPLTVVLDSETQTYRAATQASNPYRPLAGDQPVWTTNLSDSLGRLIKVIMPDGSVAKTEYDANIVTGTDPAGRKRRSVTNALGWITRVDETNEAGQLDASGVPVQPTNYSYDVLGNLTKVEQVGTTTQQCGGEQPNCTQIREFAYDSLSRLRQATNPESGAIQFNYDSNGNLINQTDARQVVTTLTYDALNRVLTRSYSAPSNLPNYQSTLPVSYSYDNLTNAKGKLIAVTTGSTQNPFSVTEYTQFDQLGRVKKSRQTTDGTAYPEMEYTYNLSGALIEEKYPSGRIVKDTLNTDGSLTKTESAKTASGSLKTYAGNFTYTPAGVVSSMRLGNGRWESTQYNNRLQPFQIALGTSKGATNQLKLDYEYGVLNLGTGQPYANSNNGNIAKQTITVQGTNSTNGFSATQYYAYDALNRLQIASENLTPNGQATYNSWKQTFTYDRFGNRNFVEADTTTLPRNCGGGTQVCPADRKVLNPAVTANSNRIKLDQDGDQINDYLFDSSGNTTKDAQSRTFIYDAENRQTEVKDSQNVTTGQYWYDSSGNRVKKYVPSTGETTIFVYDASDRLVAEYSTVVASAAQAKVSYLTNDHLGSPRILTDANGGVISRRDFQPFGEEIFTLQRAQGLGYTDDNIRQNFTGYQRDNETSLDFAESRYLNAGVGRFTSPDNFLNDTHASNPQSWNLYAYVRNNPLKMTDPSGGKAEVVSVYDEETNTTRIRIRASFVIYGAAGQNVSKEELERQKGILTKGILAAWNKQNGQVDGRNYEITTEITVQVADNEAAAIATGADNLVEVGTEPLYSTDGERLNGNVGHREGENFDRMRVSLSNPDPLYGYEGVYAHEFGHLLDAPDLPYGLFSNGYPTPVLSNNDVKYLFSERTGSGDSGDPPNVLRKDDPNLFLKRSTRPYTDLTRAEGSRILGSKISNYEVRQVSAPLNSTWGKAVRK